MYSLSALACKFYDSPILSPSNVVGFDCLATSILSDFASIWKQGQLMFDATRNSLR